MGYSNFSEGKNFRNHFVTFLLFLRLVCQQRFDVLRDPGFDKLSLRRSANTQNFVLPSPTRWALPFNCGALVSEATLSKGDLALKDNFLFSLGRIK